MFGAPLIKKQQVRHTLAELKTDCMIARIINDNATSAYANKVLDNETISMTKYWTSEKEVDFLTQCQQLFGGYGFMEEYPIATAWTQARVDPIHGGTSEIMKEIISRRIVYA